MKTYNIPPYYDDFAEKNDFHQIMFKPGFAVQARELTQLQTILRDQIEKFGNHIFKHGSVVIPGNSFAELHVPCVKLAVGVNALHFASEYITGATSNVKAVVKKVVLAADGDPDTLYLSYISGGTTAGTPNGYLTFIPGETIYVDSNQSITATVSIDPTQSYGSIANVNSGVYYINGSFVSVQAQSIIISKYTSNPSAHVLLKITEEMVDYSGDVSLLDPAQGSYNYSAPGADRLKISLELISLPLGTTITQDYVELMRFNEGVLEEHSRYPKYSELEKSLARRTFEESGDYIVYGFDVKVKEHKRIGNNGGEYFNGDSSKLVYTVSPGKAYISGFGVETINQKMITVDKCRSDAHIKFETVKFKSTYGQYILITDLQGPLSIQTRELITLYNGAVGGAAIGTANVLAVDYYTGDGSSHPIYKLYITELNIGQNSLNDVGSFTGVSSGATAKVVNEYLIPLNGQSFNINEIVSSSGSDRVATVSFWSSSENKLYAYKHSATLGTPRQGEMISGSVSTVSAVIIAKSSLFSAGGQGTIFPLPNPSTKTLKDSLNNYEMKYTSNISLTITSGASATTTTIGTIVPIETGTFIAVSNVGIIDNDDFDLSVGGNQITLDPVAWPTGAPSGGITIYCQMVNETNTIRTKTVTTTTATKTAALEVILNHADVFNLVSIILDGVDITNDYTLNPNATEYSYNLSKLELTRGISLQPGSLTITYEYFAHSAGDYFSVDSYTSLGPDYLEQIPTYISSQGVVYNLRDCIDFRNTAGTPAGILVNDAIISTPVQRFMPRFDSICLDKSGILSCVSGYPADFPKPPAVPTGLYEIERIYIPAYTNNVLDIEYTRIGTTRYTMKDVEHIDRRINRLEEFSTLTAVESSAIQTNVIDAISGLDRFKTGYLVENFTDPFLVTDTFTSDLKVTMNSTDGMFAKTELMNIPLNMSGTAKSDIAINGELLTLSYTETEFASVDTSSRTTNLNPFLVISWIGNMSIFPSSVSWVETLDNPEKFNTINKYVEVIVWTNSPPVPIGPILNPANPNPFVAGPWTPADAKIGPSIPSGLTPTPMVGPVGTQAQSGPPWTPPVNTKVETFLTHVGPIQVRVPDDGLTFEQREALTLADRQRRLAIANDERARGIRVGLFS